MTSSSDKVSQLRQLLAERFGRTDFSLEEVFSTGLPSLDVVGIARSALTEIVSSANSGAGGALLLYGLLHVLAQRSERVALVDGKDAFQPKNLPQGDLTRCI